MNKLNTYNIFLNSKNRDVDYFNYVSAGTPNFLAYCGWYLKQLIKKTTSDSYFTISVKSLVLPFSFNNISTTNNSFVFIWGLTGYAINVDIGNPNILQLLDDIKAKILTLAPTLTNLITFVYNSSSNTVTINNLSGTTMEFLFLNNFIGRMLGFLTNLIISPSTSASSAININVNPCENIFIRCDNLSFYGSYESLVSKSNISDIIAMIPIQTSSGNYIIYNDSSSFETRINDDKIDFIQLYLTSIEDDDHILDLKLDWTIHVQINEYKNNNNNNINLQPISNSELNSELPNRELLNESNKLIDKQKELENKLKLLELKKKTFN
jgi:hypothetical protein